MQEVIVYRNPLEAAIWHGLSNGAFFPIICGVVAFFLVFLLANKVLVGRQVFRVPKWKTNLSLGLGVLAAAITIYGMWI